MWEWVITYWVQVFFGLVAAGFGLLAKKFWNMYQNEKQRDKEVDFNKCKEQIESRVGVLEDKFSIREDVLVQKIDKVNQSARAHEEELKQDMGKITTNLDALTKGLLVIEGAYFIDECKDLLRKDTITEDEYHKLTYDHEAYNGLGGNHVGDQLYHVVTEKYMAQEIGSIKK